MRLQNKLGEQHPNIWICIEGFQKEEVKIAIDYVRVSTGTKNTRGRNKKEIQKDLDIVAAKAVYSNSSSSFLDIVKLLGIYTSVVPEF